jgi:hypothetical protein
MVAHAEGDRAEALTAPLMSDATVYARSWEHSSTVVAVMRSGRVRCRFRHRQNITLASRTRGQRALARREDGRFILPDVSAPVTVSFILTRCQMHGVEPPSSMVAEVLPLPNIPTVRTVSPYKGGPVWCSARAQQCRPQQECGAGAEPAVA